VQYYVSNAAAVLYHMGLLFGMAYDDYVQNTIVWENVPFFLTRWIASGTFVFSGYKCSVVFVLLYAIIRQNQ